MGETLLKPRLPPPALLSDPCACPAVDPVPRDRKFPGSVFSADAPVVEFLRFLLFGVRVRTERGFLRPTDQAEPPGDEEGGGGGESESGTEPDQERARDSRRKFSRSKKSPR
ncbi:hypothetical protein INR49_007781 [Caranx melampygus]|nr:hypothetical protein INR49_007781 [Caranx melampygus]